MINEDVRRIWLNLDYWNLFKRLSPEGSKEMLLAVMESYIIKDNAPIKAIKEDYAKWCAEMWSNDMDISLEIHEKRKQRLSKRGKEGATQRWMKSRTQTTQPDIPFVEAEEVERYPFEEFWNLYDKKRARGECEHIWHRLSDEDKAQIMTHVPQYVTAEPRKEYRKDPRNYLSKRGWEDEIITPQSNGNYNIQPNNGISQRERNIAIAGQALAEAYANVKPFDTPTE